MKEKMSTSFTSDNLINYCIEKNFFNNSIKHLRYIKSFALVPNETVIQIENDKVTILDQHKAQDKLRLKYFSDILSYALGSIKNLNCKIIVNICDGCRSTEKYTRLCFSSSLSSNHIQIPDPHIFHYIKNRITDTLEFNDKQDKLIFIGSDTGILGEDLINERIRFCHRAKPYDHIYAKISNFVHFNDEMLADVGVCKNDITSQYINIPEQLKYKYILNINGNTASWDRIPWVMASNSYIMNLYSEFDECNWYTSFIKYNNIIDDITMEEIFAKDFKYEDSKKQKQKLLAGILLDEMTQIEYFKQALIEYNRIYNS
jgi:hypothetical protein